MGLSLSFKQAIPTTIVVVISRRAKIEGRVTNR